ncbi:MAG: sigma-70 family RNA polymerase sigma factor [Coleofasciculaceae cyanobacterium]
MTDSDSARCTSTPEEAFDSAIAEVLGPGNPHSYSTIPTIERFLRQFNLASRFEAHEILNEAYLRGKEFLDGGGVISNHHSWFKGTCLNIIREKSRQRSKEQLMEPNLLELFSSKFEQEKATERPEMANQIEALYKSLEILSQTDREGVKLLSLKSQGLSWREIHEQLISEEGEAPSESTLRQRGHRAKKNLRKIYHQQTNDSADLPVSQ